MWRKNAKLNYRPIIGSVNPDYSGCNSEAEVAVLRPVIFLPSDF
jgi:hypothetical protein